MVMTESVELAALPATWNVVYTVPGVHNLCENSFADDGVGATLVTQRNVFRFTGAMRLVGLLFRSSFPRETEKSLAAFAVFATSRLGNGR